MRGSASILRRMRLTWTSIAAIERRGVAAAGKIEQLVAGQDPLRMLGEGHQQLVLAGGEIDDDAVRRLQPAAAEVELPAGESQSSWARGVADRGRGRRPTRRRIARMRASSSRGLNGLAR